MTDAPIFIHAGAHRTGTSSFQMCLHVNRAVLHGAGYTLAYPGRDGIPSGRLEVRLPGGVTVPDDAADRARASLAAYMDDRPLILSEENIPGRMFHFMKGQFYPRTESRAHVLRAAIDRPIAHVVLVLRPYDEMFVSGYRKRAEDNPVRPFADLRPSYMAVRSGWPKVLRAVRDILKPAAITAVPYPKRGTSVALLQRLVPALADIPLEEPARVVNLSATDAALEALQARYHAGVKLRRPEWKAMIGAHADDRSDRGFAAFTDTEKVELTKRYNADLNKIAKMPGITLT